jgi:hypothetical protein
MFAIIFSLFSAILAGFRRRAALQAEILALRRQLVILQRTNRDRRLRLTVADRLLWVWLSPLAICPRDCEAEDGHPLAPTRIPAVLELEEPTSPRSPVRASGVLFRRLGKQFHISKRSGFSLARMGQPTADLVVQGHEVTRSVG